MLDNEKFLPWSGRRYKIDVLGRVFNNGIEIETFIKDKEIYVMLEWILGKREYKVALLVLVTYELLSLPEYLLDKVIPLYKDKSFTNLSPTNLLYKFKNNKLEIEKYPGFYYIPFYSDYGININGDLININTGKNKIWSVTKPNFRKNSTGGYLYSRVINNFGFSKIIFQHRALCLVFKDYDENIEKLVVNHIDGNPSNNNIVNLELVTYKENNTHAIENNLRGDNKPVLCKNISTGEILKFPSILACGRHFGQPKAGFVTHRLNNCRDKIFPDLLQFKYDDGLPWPIVDINNICRIGISSTIAARNVFTGNIILFSGALNGFEHTGVKQDTITSHIRENKNIPINGWNFRWFSENIDWPIHSELHLKIYNKYPIYPPDGAFVEDMETGEKVFYESISDACNKLKIIKRLFYNLVKSNKLFKNRFKFSIFDIRKNLGHPNK